MGHMFNWIPIDNSVAVKDSTCSKYPLKSGFDCTSHKFLKCFSYRLLECDRLLLFECFDSELRLSCDLERLVRDLDRDLDSLDRDRDRERVEERLLKSEIKFKLAYLVLEAWFTSLTALRQTEFSKLFGKENIQRTAITLLGVMADKTYHKSWLKGVRGLTVHSTFRAFRILYSDSNTWLLCQIRTDLSSRRW